VETESQGHVGDMPLPDNFFRLFAETDTKRLASVLSRGDLRE
jgi:hypothetical protein